MEKKQKVSHPNAEEQLLVAITDAITRYYSLLLSREIRKGIRSRK